MNQPPPFNGAPVPNIVQDLKMKAHGKRINDFAMPVLREIESVYGKGCVQITPTLVCVILALLDRIEALEAWKAEIEALAANCVGDGR